MSSPSLATRLLHASALGAALVFVCAALAAAAGALTLRGDGGRDVLRGTAGADRLFAGRGRDTLYGGRGNDRLSGGPGRDRLVGGRGRDTLRGGTGHDLLIGGAGRDRISCGPGRDRVVLDRFDRIAGARAGRPHGSCERVTRTGAPRPDAFLVAAGDIADCDVQGDEITAQLVDALPGTVAVLGDAVYDNGTAQEFAQCYEPSWGRHKSRTRPAVGNHEYGTPGASGYFDYFGPAAGAAGLGWYSYDLGAWHVIVLNSNCAQARGCQAGSDQESWLRADLRANRAECTLAYMHHPRFSSGNTHGGSASVEPLWRALYDYGAEVVLAGHEHDYERLAPLTPTGAPDLQRGVRQFVVGTGGKSLRSLAAPLPATEARQNTALGVLHMRLRDGSYDWRFVAQPGRTFADEGSTACH
jgi:Ca2+-binding RTX toxin-like protein